MDSKNKAIKKHIWIIIAICILFLIILFVGIKMLNQDSVSGGNRQITAAGWYTDFVFGRSYSNLGVLYRNDNLICFSDPQSGLDEPICDKVDCTHTSSDCSAYIQDALMFYAITDQDKLLYVTDSGAATYGQGGIYEADLNGRNRREIAAFENIQEIQVFTATDEWILIGYYNQYDENLEPLDTYTAGIYVYNRQTNEGNVIWSENQVQAKINMLTIHEDTIYAYYYYYDISTEEFIEHLEDSAYISDHCREKLYAFSFDGDYEILEPEHFENVKSVSPVFCENSIFYSTDTGIYQYDVSDRTETFLCDSVIMIPTYLDGKVLFYDSNENPWKLYLYQGETEEMTLINEDITDGIILGAFEEYSYLYDFSGENGEGVFKHVKTDDLLNGVYEPQEFTSE